MSQKAPSPVPGLFLPLLLLFALAAGHSYSDSIAGLAGEAWRPALEKSLPLVFGTLVWIAGAFALGRALFTLILNPMIRSRTGINAPAILANFIHAALMIITIPLIIKYVFDRPIGGLVASSGLVTLIIGVAIRDMIADFFSGLAMNIERPYSIGDWIELEPGVVGRVMELNWRSTRLMTQSHRTVIVPNNNLAARQFVNYSLPERRYRESIEIALNYTTDPDRAENILTAALMATRGLAKDAPHNVRIREFGERGVVYEIRFWIDDLAEKVGVRHRLAANVLRYLHQAGIPIPYAQQEVVISRKLETRQERRMDVGKLLSRMDLLAPLTRDELGQLATVAKACDYPAGTVIFRHGDEGSSLYLLVEGVAEASVGVNGDQTSVAKIEPGQAFGEMSVLTGAPRAATVRALTKVHALKVRREDLEPIFRARPEIATELADVMARRVRSNEKHLANLSDDHAVEEHTSRARHIAGMISHFFGIGPAH